MKQTIFLTGILLSFASLAGVGGSVGGGSARAARDLNFYIKSRTYDPKIPVVTFDSEDAQNNVPVNEVCIRNENEIESKKEIEVKHYDNQGFVTHSTMETVKRSRNYMKTVVIPHILRPSETIQKEALIPRDYLIEVYRSSGAKEGNPRLFNKIPYSIEDCE
jgi:hypothetical protein